MSLDVDPDNMSSATEGKGVRATGARIESQLRFFSFGVGLIVLVLLTVIFRELAGVLKPLFIAFFLCYLILPAVDFLVARRVPRVIAYLISTGTIFALLYGVGELILVNMESFAANLPAYEASLARYEASLNALAHRLKVLPPDRGLSLLELAVALPGGSLVQFLSNSTASFFSFLGDLMVVVFFMVFLLLEVEKFPERIELAWGPGRSNFILVVLRNVNRNVQRYLKIKVLVSLATSLLAMVVMMAFELDFYVLLAGVVFLLNFIPYFGSILATVLPFMVGLLQFGAFMPAFWLGLLLTVVQNLLGNVLEPAWQGRDLNLSPLLILLALGFWAWLWGVTGMILAVPIMVTIRIALEQLDETRPYSILMSNIDHTSTREKKHLEDVARQTAQLRLSTQLPKLKKTLSGRRPFGRGDGVASPTAGTVGVTSSGSKSAGSAVLARAGEEGLVHAPAEGAGAKDDLLGSGAGEGDVQPPRVEDEV